MAIFLDKYRDEASQKGGSCPDAAAIKWLAYLPTLVCLLSFVAALMIVATGHWRKGSFVAGCAVGLAGLLRLVLPERLAGLLIVRSKLLDVVILMATAFIMIGLTLVVPHSKPGALS